MARGDFRVWATSVRDMSEKKERWDDMTLSDGRQAEAVGAEKR
jgi:hypothetical protein